MTKFKGKRIETTDEITKLLIDLVKQNKFEDFFNKYGIENGRELVDTKPFDIQEVVMLDCETELEVQRFHGFTDEEKEFLISLELLDAGDGITSIEEVSIVSIENIQAGGLDEDYKRELYGVGFLYHDLDGKEKEEFNFYFYSLMEKDESGV